MTHAPSIPRRGFTLIEMVAVLIFVGAFAVLSMHLFRAATMVPQQVARTEAMEREFDRLVEQLRRDVWSAQETAVGDRSTLVLRHAGGRSTVWRINHAAGLAHRSELQQAAITAAADFKLPAAAEFHGVGPLVELRLTGGELERPVVRRFGSQLMRIGGGL